MTLFDKFIPRYNLSMVVLLLVFSFTFCTREEKSQRREFIFSIDDKEYGFEELLFDYNRFKISADISTSSNSDQQKELKRYFLIRYVNEELLYLEAQKMGIRPDMSLVDKEIEEMKDGHTELTFNTYLSSLMLTEKSLREKIIRRFAIEELINSLIRSKKFSEEELRAYYNSHRDEFKTLPMCRMRQIIVKTRDEAQNILLKLKKGSLFEDLARQYSVSPEAINGGDLGFLPDNSIDEHFLKWCRRLKESETSDIVESQEGYRIYRLIKYQPEKEQQFEDVKNKIELKLLDDFREEEYNRLLRGLRSDHKIIINEEMLDKIN